MSIVLQQQAPPLRPHLQESIQAGVETVGCLYQQLVQFLG